MRTPSPRQRAWIDNPRIRSGTTDVGPDMAIDPSPSTSDKNTVRGLPPRDMGDQDVAMRKGGKVTRVAGPKRGKEDGAIAVQKGEFVVKKSAAKKYGDKKMEAVNQGAAKIVAPAEPMRMNGARPKAAAPADKPTPSASRERNFTKRGKPRLSATNAGEGSMGQRR